MANANIKNRYLQLLDTFKSSKLQTKEQQHMQALTLLTKVFEEEEYIHMPVDGERGNRDVLDKAFVMIQNNHSAVESALAALVDDTNSLEDDLALDEDTLNTLLEVLRTEITIRALNTAGQEQYERQITESFSWPLTLYPESSTSKNFAATSVEWEPNDPSAISWIGDIESSSDSPVKVPLSDLLVNKPITIQTIAWALTSDISKRLISALEEALTDLTDGQPLDKDDFFIVSGIGVDSTPIDNPDGSGILKIKLAVPELISRVGLVTIPNNVVDHVLIINHQGVPTMYEMINAHVYIRPTAVKEVHFNITGGVAGVRLKAFFTAVLNYEEIQGGSPHITGHFADKVSHNILNTPIALSNSRIDSTPLAQGNAAARTRAKTKSKREDSLGNQFSRAKDMRAITSSTALDNIIRSTDTANVRPTSRNKAGSAPRSIGAEGQDVTRPILHRTENSAPKSNVSDSKSPPKSTPRDVRNKRSRTIKPRNATITSTPPGKSKSRVSSKNTPSNTNG